MSVADALDLLRCPRCRSPFVTAPGGVRCTAGHAFDLARQGYLNLLGEAPPRHADTAAMVEARVRFLGGGHYAPLADAVGSALREGLAAVRGDGPPGRVSLLEAGAGPGYYLDRTLAALPGRGVALDISVAAARRAARSAAPVAAVVADTWRPLPLGDGGFDGLLCVFAPRNVAEFARVLRPDGVLVVATPQADHLAGLRDRLGLLEVEQDKQERLAATLGTAFAPVGERAVRYVAAWPRAVLSDLVAMGPNAFHTEPAALAGELSALPEPLPVQVAVTVSAWRLV